MISRVESSFFARAIVCVGFKSLDPNVIPGNSAGDLFGMVLKRHEKGHLL